ncbi:uncharacterized GMC-type oxidoreductase Mb1310-like [Maniola jurtina]|uniref:uncharacterized GMC-type oxidoreductase Mb1310-like n=1 Tax=Maniola jurtina TaxID=191418 RepID=UPI001E68EBCF|nr:uncharacterized GMC-type oxidoreductase Mb1310-like [Maniola jurtina]
MVWDNACVASTGSASQLFASTLNFLTAAQCFVPDRKSPDNIVADMEKVDFIIAGGGTAGCVAANRLSEVDGWNVVLFEAGFEAPAESVIPGLDGSLYQSKYDWKYVTESDGVTLQGMKNGVVQWPRGKMLGGSSAMNAMYYVRGQDQDFQSWYDEGNTNWAPETVNKYFRKAENFQDQRLDEIPQVRETYGHDGPFVVNTFNHTLNEAGQNILDSWNHIGIKKVNDINADKFEGQGFCAISRAAAANGQRSSTYSTYLKSASDRPNLRVVPNAFVTKVLIDDNSRAYGVEVEINGEKKTVLANREVILSAGAINTPQILMLSGIGPEKELISHNIPVKVNLPGVGQNLQDHAYVPVPFCMDEPGPEDEAEKKFEILKYLYDKTGYLAHEFIMNLSAFFSRTDDMSYPEFQCHTIIFRQNSSIARSYLRTLKDEVAESFMQCQPDKALVIMAFHNLHPHSKGNICLTSNDPHTYPLLYPKYYSDEWDIQASGDGIEIVTKLLDTPYFKSNNAFIPKINLSQCDEWEYLSNDYWKCYSTHVSQTVFHPIGTAKMGSDPDAVVDNSLKVHGVEGLRVIDASVMPSETSGNTMAPVIMIGELASDLIKEEYGVSE